MDLRAPDRFSSDAPDSVQGMPAEPSTLLARQGQGTWFGAHMSLQVLLYDPFRPTMSVFFCTALDRRSVGEKRL